MPNTTGTANTAVDLQIALNTHLTANGWTKLLGSTDQTCASPITARYWRILVTESQQTLDDFRELKLLNFRTTSGGANVTTTAGDWTISSIGTGSASDLVSGTGALRSADIDDAHWTLTYDFGSGTIVREVVMQCGDEDFAPESFFLQWSHDNYTWNTMLFETFQSWTTDETKTYTITDTDVYADHYDGTHVRRTGLNSATQGDDQKCQGLFLWQGPGYDATRRVYINCTAQYSLGSSYENWVLGASTQDFDETLISPWSQASGADSGANPRFTMPLGPFTYWIYSNSSRVIVVVKNGVDDYLMCYLGFAKVFADPDDYQFPLVVAGPHYTNNDLTVDNARDSNPHDPGDGGSFRMMRWDGTWVTFGNHPSNANTSLYTDTPYRFVWPYHGGSAGDGSWPATPYGDNDSYGTHWLAQVVPTAQSELFLWPCIMVGLDFGNYGALDGVFAVPGGGILSPEQLLTIDAVDYRVFSNRQRSDGNHYFAIRED